MEKGKLRLPPGPGLGVELNCNALARFKEAALSRTSNSVTVGA
jgi:hypothetical protein